MILNLTQHNATQEQIEAGVIEPSQEDKETIKRLLTFNDIPTFSELYSRASDLAIIASEYDVECVMIGGAPYLMSNLESAIIAVDLTPVCAFSKRVSIEKTLDDGSVVKQTVFKHIGFVYLY